MANTMIDFFFKLFFATFSVFALNLETNSFRREEETD